MSTVDRTTQQRDTLIRNVLRTAAERGHLLTVGTMLDVPVRIRDRETDYPLTVAMRRVTSSDVRCD